MNKTNANERYSIVDNQTGQVFSLDLRIIGESRDFDKKQKFYKFMDVFTDSILMDNELIGKSIRLLFWILKQLDFGETTFILNPDYVVEDLKVTKRTFYNWKKALEKKGIIEKVTGDLYILNPNCVAYGTATTKGKRKNISPKILKGDEND